MDKGEAFGRALLKVVDKVQQCFFLVLVGRRLEIAEPSSNGPEGKLCRISRGEMVTTVFTQQLEGRQRRVRACVKSDVYESCEKKNETWNSTHVVGSAGRNLEDMLETDRRFGSDQGLSVVPRGQLRKPSKWSVTIQNLNQKFSRRK